MSRKIAFARPQVMLSMVLNQLHYVLESHHYWKQIQTRFHEPARVIARTTRHPACDIDCNTVQKPS